MRTLITIVAFLSFGLLSEIQAQEKHEILSPQEFCDKMKSDDVQIIDVRTPKEYKNGHIKNSTLINFFDDDFKEQLSKLPEDKKILVYCRSGNRSGKASEILENLGYKNIYDLKGGMLLWEKAKTDCY
ncbi:rhodanese-like domain-containing protein [Psychroflexus halocasei]|uniref:Rhodanese-related sulfurtransferase n=1 Tax=Psychroflexus halocasei TaxID=908615 RepID=A0A1H3ZUU1_9FLAO|nr:rhodanese-like domain-containing protein [Psychroflexus halocasei]SEA27487.1 Rhodanese-related sulfurtransferase [Psychroflexus halocasei]